MNNQNGQNMKPVSQEQKVKKGLFGKKTEDNKNKVNTNNTSVNNITKNMNNNINMQNNNQVNGNFSNMNNAGFNNVPQNNKPYISQNKKPYISNNGNSKNKVNNANTNSFNNMTSSMSNTNSNNNNINNNGMVQNNISKMPNNFSTPGSMPNNGNNNNMNNNVNNINTISQSKVDPVSSLTSLENSNAIFPVLDKKGNTANNISSSLNNDLLRSLDSVSPISNNNISINNSSYKVPPVNNNISINNQGPFNNQNVFNNTPSSLNNTSQFNNQNDSGVQFDASNFNEDPISLDNRLEIEEEKKLQDEILGDISSDMDDSVETLSYDYVKAGAIPRILSFITDYIIIVIAAFVFFISFSTILTFVDSQVLVVLQYIIFTLILSLGFIFYRGMNEKYGTTIGRKVTKTMIVTKDGNKVNLPIALLRNLVSSILNGILIGGVSNIVMMFIDKEKRSIEDIIFKTMTVRTDM